jgi:hypothetical protein
MSKFVDEDDSRVARIGEFTITLDQKDIDFCGLLAVDLTTVDEGASSFEHTTDGLFEIPLLGEPNDRKYEALAERLVDLRADAS